MVQKYVNTSIDGSGKYLIILNASSMKPVFDTKQFIAVNGTFLVLLLLFSFVYYLYKGRGFHFPDRIIPQSFLMILVYGLLMLSPYLLHIVVHFFKPIVLLQSATRVNVVILPLLTFIVANTLGNIISNFGKLKFPTVAVLFVVIAVITVMFPIKTNLDIVAQKKGPIPTDNVSMGEYEPREFFNYNMANEFKTNDNFLGKSEKYNVIKNNHKQVLIKVEDNSHSRTIMLPRVYYKGYQVKLSYNDKSVTVPAATKNGLAAVRLPSGFKSGTITVMYKMTMAARIGWTISIISLLYIIWAALKRFRKVKI